MGFHSILSAGIILGYTLGTILFLVGILVRKDQIKNLASGFAVLGFCLHSVVMGLELAQHPIASLPRGFYIQMLSWFLLVIFFILWWRLKLEFLALTASPLALLFYLASFGLPIGQATMPKSMVNLFLGLHIGSLFISFALLAMACSAGLLFMFLDRKIKSKEKLVGFQKDLPSLSVFDRVNHWAVLLGFPLFTLGMLSGFFWAKLTWGKVVSWDPKEVVSLLIWFLYAFLFHQRIIIGWRGRKPANLAILIFCGALLSLLVVNFMMPTHHSFKS